MRSSAVRAAARWRPLSLHSTSVSAKDLVLRVTDGSVSVTVDVAVDAGARLRQITVSNAGDHAELLAAAPPDAPATSTGWGSFPMVPWAGRIRHGRFRFRGDDVKLDLNHSDENDAPGTLAGGGPIDPPYPAPKGPLTATDRRHAIHGTTFARPWTLDAADDSTCDLHCSLTGALGWPYAGLARQCLRLYPDRLELDLAVESTSDSVFPASIGWHPWFAKPNRLTFEPVVMYVRDEIGLPTGELVPPSTPPWDECFVNHQPVLLHYDRRIAPTVTVRADTNHWVVYDMPELATCVEPQSGPPNSLTLRPIVVEPGHPLAHSMTISW
jgi:aldose 1-epimerase